MIKQNIMTKKDLIKKILELGKELEKSNGFDAVMIINDMEIEVDNYTKQLPIHNTLEQKESNNNGSYTLLPTVLDEIIEYIEETDQQIEWERGHCRALQEVKHSNDMPDIYYKLIVLKNGG